MKRVLLLLPTTGYRNDDFLAAAKALEVEIIPAANYCHQLAPQWGFPPIMALEFDRPEKAAEAALRELGGKPDAVLAVDDSGVELAALLAERLGLPGNPAGAVRRTPLGQPRQHMLVSFRARRHASQNAGPAAGILLDRRAGRSPWPLTPVPV